MTLTPEELRTMLPHASEELVALNCSDRGPVAGKAFPGPARAEGHTASEGPDRKAKARAGRGHPEAEFQATVIDLLRTLGYLVYHVHDSRFSEPGFPDIVAIHPQTGKQLAWELKVTHSQKLRTARMSPKSQRYLAGQQDWLDAFKKAGADTRVVCPEDWDATVLFLNGKVEWYCVRPNSWEQMSEVLQ